MSVCNYMKRNYDSQDSKPGTGTSSSSGTTAPFDLNNFTLQEIFDMFDITKTTSLEDLKKIKRKILLMHPDKQKHISQDKYIFMTQAFAAVEKYFDIDKKINAELPKEGLQYNDEYLPKNKTMEQEINKISPKEFNTKFNEIFENKIKKYEENDDLTWFREDKNIYDNNIKSAKEIHSQFDTLRSSKNGLIIYQEEYRPFLSNSGSSFFDESHKDTHGYITCNPFDSLKYDDIKRVYRDQPIIAVDTQEFKNAEMKRLVDDYKITPVIDSKTNYNLQLEKQKEMYNDIINEKKHNLYRKIDTNEKLTQIIQSEFMLLH